MSLLPHVIRHRFSRLGCREFRPRRWSCRRFVGGCTLVCFLVELFGLPLSSPVSNSAEPMSVGGEATADNQTTAQQGNLREALRHLIRPGRAACCCGQDARRAGRCCCRKTSTARASTCWTRDSATNVSASRPTHRQSGGPRHPAWTTCGCDSPSTKLATSAEPRFIGPPVGLVAHPVPQDGLVQTVSFYRGPSLTPDPPPPRFISFGSLS